MSFLRKTHKPNIPICPMNSILIPWWSSRVPGRRKVMFTYKNNKDYKLHLINVNYKTRQWYSHTSNLYSVLRYKILNFLKETSGQSNLTWGRIATAHGRFSRILQVAPMCTPYIKSQKWLPWQHPLEPRNPQCLHRIAWPWKPTPRIKQRVASYHTTKVIAHRKAKRGCHGNVP